MTTTSSTDLRYPIGTYRPAATVSDQDRKQWIEEIGKAPAELRAAVAGLTPKQLDTPYRPDGWTVRQVVHHVPDSHMNAYVRYKLALTEENPTIKPYDEAGWANLSDTRTVPIDVSLQLLELIHVRWMAVLRSLDAKDLQRTFFHPEKKRTQTLDQTLGLYAWHGKHHVAHITSLREREGW